MLKRETLNVRQVLDLIQGLRFQHTLQQSELKMCIRDSSTPKQDKLQKIADYFEVSLDYLIGNTNIRHIAKENKNNTVLTKKDERDIQKKLDSILKDLDNSEDTLMYDGEPMDDLTKELVKDSLEHIIRLAKISAKEKYTPKKYRK